MRVVVTEKYNQGEIVADSLMTDHQRLEKFGEPYWTDGDLIVIPLQGQIFELYETENRSGYPDFPSLGWRTKERHEDKKRLLEFFLTEDLDEVILAGDYDREGELISWLAVLVPVWGRVDRQLLRQWDVTVTRMEYSAMTTDEIRDAWEDRDDPNDRLFEEGRARVIVDYDIGINLSRAIIKCVARITGDWESLSAGRVQTPLLNLVDQQTKKHENHDPETYWIPSIEVTE